MVFLKLFNISICIGPGLYSWCVLKEYACFQLPDWGHLKSVNQEISSVSLHSFTDINDSELLLSSTSRWNSCGRLYFICQRWEGWGVHCSVYICVCTCVCDLPSVFHPMCLSVFRATPLTCSRVSALRTITHGIRSINNYWHKITDTYTHLHAQTHLFYYPYGNSNSPAFPTALILTPT